MSCESVVIGIGNPFRQDDGVGHVVADEVAKRRIPGVQVITAIGEPGEILDAWRDVPRAVVVDAAVWEGMTPGRIERWIPGEVEASGVVSSHTLGVAQTFALAQALGQVPGELVVFSIAVAEVGHGVGLTPQVAAAVPVVVDAIHAEVSTAPRR
jgi:hydrogenase maturation protease